MRRRALALWVLGILSSQIHAGPSSKTLYECKGPQKEVLSVLSEEKGLVAKELNAQGETLQTWPLQYDKSFLDAPNSPIRYLATLPEITRKSSVGYLFELREQILRDSNPQRVKVGIIKSGQILKGWECSQKQGVALKVLLLTEPENFTESDLKWNTRIVKSILNEKELQAEAVRMFMLILERYSVWKEQMPLASWKRQVLQVFQPLTYLSPQMLPNLEGLLSPKTQECFKLILESISFREFAPLQRWVFWIRLFENKNFEAVRMGIRGFMNSPLFGDGSVQELFLRETKDVFRGAPQGSLTPILEGLNPQEQEYLQKLWKRSKS